MLTVASQLSVSTSAISLDKTRNTCTRKLLSLLPSRMKVVSLSWSYDGIYIFAVRSRVYLVLGSYFAYSTADGTIIIVDSKTQKEVSSFSV